MEDVNAQINTVVKIASENSGGNDPKRQQTEQAFGIGSRRSERRTDSDNVGVVLSKRSVGGRRDHHKDPLRILSIDSINSGNSFDTSSVASFTRGGDLSVNAKKNRRRRKKYRYSAENIGYPYTLLDNAVSCAKTQSQFSQQNKIKTLVTMDGGLIKDKDIQKPSVSCLSSSDSNLLHERSKKQKLMSERYRYGNFNFYYQKKKFNNQVQVSSIPLNSDPLFQRDPRVDLFLSSWFAGKRVLDIGCNSGIFTINLGLRYRPTHITGIDIDQHLINAARKNLRYFFDRCSKITTKFPVSFFSNFGPVSLPFGPKEHHDIPNNIKFIQGNYVLPNDHELENQTEEYDIVIALATIKWIHLNWGDAGVKRFFSRVFLQLKPDGRFILETESFNSYRKHCSSSKRLPEDVLENFKSIHFMPEIFTNYLIDDVGFSHVEEMDTPISKSMGVGRLQVFYKGKFMIEHDERRDVPVAATSVQAIEEGGRFLQQQQMLCTPPTMDSMSPYEPANKHCGFTPEHNNGINEWNF